MNLAIHEPWEKSVPRAEENGGPRGVEDVKFLQFERTNDPHPKSAHPAGKSAPKSIPKICTKTRVQNPHQHPHPKSQPIPTEPYTKRPQWMSLALSLAQIPKNHQLHQKFVPRLWGWEWCGSSASTYIS